MPWTLDNALEDDLITVVDRDDSAGFYEVRVGDLNIVVAIKLSRHLDSDTTDFQLSHAINTPVQAGPYRTSTPTADDPPYALHRAIDGLTSYYRDAVKLGHTPQENWLVPNA